MHGLMTVALIVLSVLVLAVLAVELAGNWSARNGVLKSRFRDNVLVTTKEGTVFSGVLFAGDHKVLVLRNAEAVGVGDNAANIPLDGEIIVLMADISYLQRP